MIIGTLFSGIGAPEQAAIRVYGDKFEHVFACEWDKFARQSFTAIYDFGGDHFHKDINDMDGKQYKDKVDCIIGGSPCQDFSIGGLRAGVDGHRGQLIWQYFRIIDEARPKVFIYENVKGMVSDKNGKTIQDFLEVFRSIGYYCHWEVLNSKDYGVPQNRERVFIVGFLDHEAYYRFQFAPKIKLTKRLKDVLESEVDEKYYLSNKFIQGMKVHKERHHDRGNGFAFNPENADEIDSVNCISCGYGNRATDTYINEGVVGMLDIKGNDQIRRVYGTYGTAPCLQTMQGGNREPKIQVRSATSCGYEEATIYDSINLSNPKSETRRGRVGKQVAQTLDCSCNQAVVEPEYRIRKLTPLECWRLQDFPDEAHEKAKAAGVSDSQRYKQAGNSITVAVMEMILIQANKALKGYTEGLF